MSSKTGTNLVCFLGLAYVTAAFLCFSGTIDNQKLFGMALASVCFTISDIVKSLYTLYSKKSYINNIFAIFANKIEYAENEVRNILNQMRETKRMQTVDIVSDFILGIGIVVAIIMNVLGFTNSIPAKYADFITVLSFGLAIIMIFFRECIKEREEKALYLELSETILNFSKVAINSIKEDIIKQQKSGEVENNAK